MRGINKYFGKIDAHITNLESEIESLKGEIKYGKNEAWFKDQRAAAVERTREKVEEAKSEISREVALEGGRLNDLKKTDTNYSARAYNLQVAQAMAQGKNSEQLIKALDSLDREQMQYKNEYIKVFGQHIDPDYSLQWQDAVEKYATPEEREYNAARQELTLYEGYLPTMGSHIESELEAVATGGKRSMPVAEAFEKVQHEVKVKMNPPLKMSREAAEKLVPEVE